MNHQFALRVYYEDTDMAGIVYYANYLKFSNYPGTKSATFPPKIACLRQIGVN